MPLSMLQRIGEVEVRPTRMTLQLADSSIKYPHGIVEDLLVKVDKFWFLHTIMYVAPVTHIT
uniref:Uncharacterized protein n=1 Tax=Cajanus cajan TaxID=3821 RepID=A0A151TZ95_CAJCA|nr:hypothetical protein KK1_004991 [Cajanus cajan]